jgi:predicted HAD superfamily phosphohydrolase YqeG
LEKINHIHQWVSNGINKNVMATKIKTRITFNEWARQLRVSSLWDATKPENREFIKKLEDARFVFTQIRNNG